MYANRIALYSRALSLRLAWMDRPSENVLYRLHMDSSTKRYAQLETYDTVMFQETEFVSIAQGLCAKRTTLLKEEVSSASNTANANMKVAVAGIRAGVTKDSVESKAWGIAKSYEKPASVKPEFDEKHKRFVTSKKVHGKRWCKDGWSTARRKMSATSPTKAPCKNRSAHLSRWPA